MNECQECGMILESPNEYHPYGACLMFKGCHDGRKVRANLDAVRASGAQWESDHATEPLRDRLAAIERQMRIMARGLRAAEGLRAGSPGIDDAEVQQWQRWYDEALALSLNIDAPDAEEQGRHGRLG